MESRLPALPIELWRIILLLAGTPSRVLPVPASIIETNVAPVALSHVCRSWRYLVINSPEFWTDISYTFESNTDLLRPSLEFMKLCLERSLGMPLTLDIDISDIGYLEDRSVDYEFLLALFANRKRWTSATLYMELERIDDDAWEDIDALVEDAPLLETLKLMVAPGESEFGDIFNDTLCRLWKGAPKLTQLSVEFMWTGEDIEEPVFTSDWILTNGIPYHQLTHLCVDPSGYGEINWTQVASIFALAPNLVACSLYRIKGHRDQVRPSTPRVVLQRLQHLDLSGPYYDSEDPDENDGLLLLMNGTLTSPSLQTLALKDPSEMWDENADAYANFMVRSNPPLRSLRFGISPSTSTRSLLECIRLSPPTLRSLHTDHIKMSSPEFSERMSEWDKEAAQFKLCPVLQQLMFNEWTSTCPPIPKEMVDMLRKRLLPPNGSSGSFNQLNVPISLRGRAEEELKSLMDDPYCLHLEYVTSVFPPAEARFW